jgi:N-acylneuraminate cytidylyltransferase
MHSLCIIPARGGSKRIPRKNIKDFHGKPILAYSIQAALESDLFSEVMVSTDDEEIASLAIKYGAKIPFLRSDVNANDYATTVDVLLEVLDSYQRIDRFFETACCIYPTAPLISNKRLIEGERKLKDGDYDTVFPVVRFSYSIWRAMKLENGRASMFWPENLNKRSQDLTTAYHDAGQWYWFYTQRLMNSRKLWTDNTFGLEIDEIEMQDIDTLIDWKLAELKYELLQNLKSTDI